MYDSERVQIMEWVSILILPRKIYHIRYSINSY